MKQILAVMSFFALFALLGTLTGWVIQWIAPEPPPALTNGYTR